MLNDQKSFHTQPFSRTKQAASSGIGCNTGAMGRCTPRGICSCVLFFRGDGDKVTVLICLYQPCAAEHVTLLVPYTLTFQHKYYGFSIETESGFGFTDYSFCTFTSEVICNVSVYIILLKLSLEEVKSPVAFK